MRRRLISWLRGDLDRELNSELESHLATEEEALQRSGIPADEAKRTSRLAFGNLTNVKEDVRGVWAWTWWERWIRDFQRAARSLSRRIGFSLFAVAVLALGIGPTSAMFAIVNVTVLRPLPYPNAERLVVLHDHLVSDPASRNLASHIELQAWTAEARSLDMVGGYTEALFTLTGGGRDAERIPAVMASPVLMELLGARVVEGRLWNAGDDAVAGRVLVSAALWKRRFGSVKLNGQSLLVNGAPAEIIGILPDDFVLLGRSYQIVSRLARPEATQMEARFLTVLGRLRVGMSIEQAGRELARLAQTLGERFPKTHSERTVTLTSVDELLRGPLRTRVLFAMAAVGSLLLITCLNVTSLMVSSNMARRDEIAVRLALGATKFDLFRMLAVELVFLALGGLTLGIVIAEVCLRLLVRFAPAEIFKLGVPGITPAVLTFASAVMLAASIGIAAESLRQLHASRDTSTGRGGRGVDANSEGLWARSVLLGGEVALAVLLIINAGTALQALARLWNTDPGFEPAEAVAMEVSLPRGYESAPRRIAFLRQLTQEASSLPGVQQAGITHRLPLGNDESKRAVNIGLSLEPSRQEMVEVRRVSPGFFGAMGMRLLRGRSISDRDTPETTGVVVVNERFVRRFIGTANPIGLFVFIQDGPVSTPVEIVGVVDDIRQAGLAVDPQPEVYISVFVQPSPYITLVLRGNPDLLPEARRILTKLDANMPLASAVPLSAFVAGSIAPQRSMAFVLSFFSVLALALATVGVYGVCAFSVARTRREIGIRIALGASTWGIVSLYLWWLLRVVVSGVSIGILLALVSNRLAARFVMDLETPGFGVVGICALGFSVVAAIAALPPAIQASTTDPTVAIK